MNAARCPYRTLEVEPGASSEEVRKGYERVRAIFGPSSLAIYALVDPAQQREALLEIEDAYRVLSDPEARRAHDDVHGHPPPKGATARGAVVPVASAVSAVPPVAPGEGAAPAQAPPHAFASPAADAAPAGNAASAAPAASAVASPASGGAPGAAPPRTTPPPLPPWVKVQGAPEERPPETLPPMPPIGPDTSFDGALLRAVRLAKGLSIREIAANTKISPTYLESIEHERWEWLPERVFLRGFLISFARELRLDPQQVSRTYLAKRDGV